jgi:DNA-binding MarR family transcriptional regulator
MSSSRSNVSKRAATVTISTAPRLSRWIQTQMGSDHDHNLSLRQLSALHAVSEPETTLGDIARKLNVTPAVVTGLVDRLERRGYVRRVASKVDRRRVHIELTAAGTDVQLQAETRVIDLLARRYAELPETQVRQLATGLDILSTIISSIDQERLGKHA